MNPASGHSWAKFGTLNTKAGNLTHTEALNATKDNDNGEY